MRLICGIFVCVWTSLLAGALAPLPCKDDVRKELPTITGWCSLKKAEAMMDLVFETAPDVCVEMGVFAGSSLFPTACALKELNHGVVYGIDPWDSGKTIAYRPQEHIDRAWWPEENSHRAWWAKQNKGMHYQNCRDLIARHGLDRFCVLFKETFATVLDQIPSIDILHINTTHAYSGDVVDAILYIQKVKKMGYIWIDGWADSPATYEYLKSRCHIKKVLDSGQCILMQKMVAD